ncbi:DNA-3-methyladenine glycosylase I [Acinetobacter sp. R933-2]|uniref:DNA-3-methyladenine glycosylase I n=1 Tax=Acinetobacter sp. R933-2 TaxID=2746728 RepID=UPI002577F823|nr:DNA-3-methyladenine glycosylase I [Acinetobacter sp. R933-2]MDM1249246.1 DNA-3-methyladenine glycosylase I [Acinetobacter sp. R933-2]
MTNKRCGWCSNDPIYIHYHDHEWGKPNRNEQHLFEMLCLEGQQAGLSWITVLKKREAYRTHFFHHPITEIAQLTDQHLEYKLQDAGLIRHIGKLKAIRDNAIAWQNMKAEGLDPVQWLWDFVDQKQQINDVPDYKLAPAQTEISQQLSKTLKKKGFKFVGPTTIYAFMQAVGMVNDHENDCSFR